MYKLILIEIRDWNAGTKVRFLLSVRKRILVLLHGLQKNMKNVKKGKYIEKNVKNAIDAKRKTWQLYLIFFYFTVTDLNLLK